MAALLNEVPSSEQKSQSLISKFSSSLQLALEVPVAIETVSVPEKGACALAGLAWKISFFKRYLSKINNIYDTVVVRFHLWSQKCNLIISLGNSFGEFDVFPVQRDRSCASLPEMVFQRWPPSDVTWRINGTQWNKKSSVNVPLKPIHTKNVNHKDNYKVIVLKIILNRPIKE